ncbi:nuclear transport factor 2 family protein [Negadavirga shengliensis]|uniref:Nuclear transport factor 2 family protein n=1 Tax=Negadavirga shengliensis TaxID=1389218 RepID=A0ABV9T5I3_9BACT
MIKNLIALTLFLFTCTLGMAQNKETAAVELAVSELREALISGEASRLKAITSEKLSYGHSNGLIENQEEFVEALVSGTSNFTAIELEDQTVEIIKDLAIVRHNLIGKTHNAGASPADVNLGVLTVWQKKGKNWVLVARQAFKR